MYRQIFKNNTIFLAVLFAGLLFLVPFYSVQAAYATFGSRTIFNNTNTEYTVSAPLDSSTAIVIYKDNAGSGTAVVASVSGTTVSYGTPLEFVFDNIQLISVAVLDSTHVVIAYADTGEAYKGTAVVGTISGTDISFGTPAVFDTSSIQYPAITAISSSKVVIAYEDDGNSGFTTAVVGTVSGTDISFGTSVVFNSAAVGVFEWDRAMAITNVDSTKVVIAYRDLGNSSYGTAIVGTVSGTDISFGSETVFNSASTLEFSGTTLDSTKVVIAYKDEGNSNVGTAIVGTISGTDISFGAEAIFNAATTTYISIDNLSSSTVIIAYRDEGNSSRGTMVGGMISGTTISVAAEIEFRSASVSYVSITSLSSAKILISWTRGSVTGDGEAAVGTIGISVSGTAYTDEGITASSEELSICAAYDGVTQNCTSSSAINGTYTISGLTLPFPGTVVTVWVNVSLDPETPAVTVTTATGSIQTGINLYKDYLITRCDNSSCSLTNANLATAADPVGYEDSFSAIYSVSGGTATLASGKNLYIPSSHTYAPGGDVSLSGKFSNAGTFTAGSNTVTLSGTAIIAGSSTFNNIAITAPATVSFTASTTQTIGGTFSCTGSAGNVITLNSTSSTAATLSKASGTVSCDYAAITNLTATGGATWNPGSNSTDGGGNTGWNFNSAPSFSAGPSDGSSSSTTPTSYGALVQFSATATDSNSDSYYLIICKTNSVTATNSGAPTCGGGSWCVSNATTSGSQASCSRHAQSSDSETNAWYAFVCDNNSSSLCSSASQGSGDSGSPFVVVNNSVGGGGSYSSGGTTTPPVTPPSTSGGGSSEDDEIKMLTEKLIALMLKLIEALQQKITILKFQKGM